MQRFPCELFIWEPSQRTFKCLKHSLVRPVVSIENEFVITGCHGMDRKFILARKMADGKKYIEQCSEDVVPLKVIIVGA